MTTTTALAQPRPRSRISETLLNFWVDIALFLMFIIDMNTHFTGIPIHEWLGIVLGGALVYHLLLHWQWIITISRRIVSRLPAIQRIRYVIDLILFVDMVIVVASGILISREALPLFGIEMGRNFYWSRLHHTSTELISWLIGLHLALSWGWISSAFSHYIWKPLTRGKRAEVEPIRPAGEVA